MSSYNKCILLGNLTRDPETRVTPKGTTICQIGLAVNSSYKDKDGNAKEEVTYVDVDCFGKQAEVIAKYMTKGKPILIDGRLKLDSWQDKDGNKRTKLKVVLDSFTFVGGGRQSDDDSGQDTRKSSRETQPEVQDNTKREGVDSEDVPF
jgi:single-strand DNA-binding protein